MPWPTMEVIQVAMGDWRVSSRGGDGARLCIQGVQMVSFAGGGTPYMELIWGGVPGCPGTAVERADRARKTNRFENSILDGYVDVFFE